jgi:hypothetical protein
MSELTLKVVVPNFDGSQPFTDATLNALLQGIAISLEGLAGSATISDGAVVTAKLADHSVTPVKLSPTVAGGGLSADDVTGLSIPSDAITPARLKFNPTTLGTSGAVIIDWSQGFGFNTYLTGNITFDFSNAKAGQSIRVRVKQAAAGAKTLSWTPTIKWRGGSAPTLTVTADKTDIIDLWFIDGVYYGMFSQNH